MAVAGSTLAVGTERQPMAGSRSALGSPLISRRDIRQLTFGRTVLSGGTAATGQEPP
jgi:hypothetical protein